MNNRNKTIDVLKGIMISAVVIGHIAGTLPPPNYNVVFSLCYSWHMFCFMMTVGFVAAKYGHIENGQQKLVLRAKRLLLPYFAWTIIRAVSLGHHTTVQILRDLFVAPLYWFLIVQFIYEMHSLPMWCEKNQEKYLLYCSIYIAYYSTLQG